MTARHRSAVKRFAAFVVLAALVALFAGCSKKEESPFGGVDGARAESIRRTAPDEYGVVCYISTYSSTALSCVKVRNE